MRITLDAPAFSGLVGQLGFTIYDGDDGITLVQARTTDDILESPAGSGMYSVEVADALLAGSVVRWDTGGDTPVYAQESFPESLDDYKSTSTFATSIANLANRAYALYPKGDLVQYRLMLTERWRQLVHRVGRIYSEVEDLVVPAGSWEVPLPADFREAHPFGVCLYASGEETVLEAAELDEVMEARIGLDPGTPTQFCFLDGVRLALLPIPDAEVTIRLHYDGEAPANLGLHDALPVQALYEDGLVAGAIAQMALNEGDYERYKIEHNRWDRTVTDWQNTQQRRARTMHSIPPLWGAPRTTLRSEG